MRKEAENLVGRRFGYLSVISKILEYGNNRKILKWLCKCDCGTEKIIVGSTLRSGSTISCGCYRINSHLTHGMSTTAEFTTWVGIRQRCYNKRCPEYKYYGARGIIVCDRWRNSFENFLEDMGKKPSPKHSLDRFPNNDTGNYELSNCRWATHKEQQGNKRNNRWLEHNGEKMIIEDWVRKLKIPSGSLYRYLKTMTLSEIIEKNVKRQRNKT